MALFERDRHETLTGTPWSETAARVAIARIVDDTHRAYGGEERLWPIHPIDVSPERAEVLKPLYYGAAGVIWTLHRLQDSGFPAVGRDYAPVFDTLAERDRADWLRIAGRPQNSYLTGAAGIHMMHWRLAPSEALLSAIEAGIEACRDDPTLSLVVGSSGAALAAWRMFERTADERWSRLYLDQAEALWRQWTWYEDLGCWLWPQALHGSVDVHIGALHGFPGIVHALLVGRSLLPAERRAELLRRVREAIDRTALREGDEVNWRLCARGSTHPGQAALRVQHCTGAPGYVNIFADLPRREDTDALLVAAGELSWSAGPLTKLPSLCHGVSGTGYAFLKLHRMTGRELWLDRARAFAMHGVEQAERGVAVHGQRKYSLWTGDLGLAAFLWDCVRAADRFPTLDDF